MPKRIGGKLFRLVHLAIPTRVPKGFQPEPLDNPATGCEQPLMAYILRSLTCPLHLGYLPVCAVQKCTVHENCLHMATPPSNLNSYLCA